MYEFKHVIIRTDVVNLAEILLASSRMANAAGRTVAQQDAAYGKIKDALIWTLASGLKDDSAPASFPDNLEVATEIYDQCVYNGEGVAYNMQIVDINIQDGIEDAAVRRMERLAGA